MAYWWGHDTIEDKAERRRIAEESQVIKWSDPESDVAIKKSTFYAPMRIENEQKALEGLYIRARFNFADWYSWTRHPWHARFTNPQFWQCQRRIKAYRRLIKSQPFIRERLLILGPDLAAAYFLCHRKCRVKFMGRDEWTEINLDGYEMPDYIPTGKFTRLRHVEVFTEPCAKHSM